MESEGKIPKSYDPEESTLLISDRRESKALSNKQNSSASASWRYALVGTILVIIVGWLWLTGGKIVQQEENASFIQEF